jgi:alkylglycerol monooxygenase
MLLTTRHRASHDINLIWSGHIPHHSSEQYNYSTALRQGVFEGPLTGIAYWFVAIIGVPHEVANLHMQFDLVFQFFVHTKFIGKLPAPIEYIFNTPSHHRVHHGTNPIYIDKNYGGILIIWDRIFGTYQEEEETVVYGVVRPLKTWSPLYANFHYLYDVLRAAWNRYKKASLSSAMSFLFRGPGWQPGQTKESKMEVLEKFWEKRKHFQHDPDSHLSMAWKIYLVSQTGFMILGLFTFTGASVDASTRFGITAVMMWCMLAIGHVMDQNGTEQRLMEVIRIIVTSTVILMLSSVGALVFGVLSSLLYFFTTMYPNVVNRIKNN